jgi:alpha-glucan, water dikinase
MSSNTETRNPPVGRQTIPAAGGLNLVVEKRAEASRVDLLLRLSGGKKCVLHWGVCSLNDRRWHSLPESLWPEGTSSAGPNAMQTPFKPNNGESRIAMALSPDAGQNRVEFVLFFPDEQRWDNNQHRNYHIDFSAPGATGSSPRDFLHSQLPEQELIFDRTFDLVDGTQLAAGVTKSEGRYDVLLVANLAEPLVLHWAVAHRSPNEWSLAPESWRPHGTVASDPNTVETRFESRDGFRQLRLVIPEAETPTGIQFVLKQGANGRWVKYQQGNFFVPVQGSQTKWNGQHAEVLGQLGERIVQAEKGSGSWTLMHRFNLCYDLVGQAQDDPEALALLFVWLRFSAIRQLTWQRNYNTKPRELAHAQDRLGDRLAELYPQKPQGRPFLRLMLATIGRGGDGQRIRDEILQIMHRHHVKEVSGHFLEEWHQKLHNNTTADDVVICQAYLEFLRSNGDHQRFYEVLQKGGVTRQRLETFERPIRSEPSFVGHLKDALIHDFENFLKILNAVHSSTDLETAIQSARNRLDNETQALLWHVWNHRNDSGDDLSPLVERITEARRRLSHLLNQPGQVRSVLYLDLALEQLVRVVVERNLHRGLDLAALVDLLCRVMENVTFSQENLELDACRRQWARLINEPPEPRSSPAWALHAKSLLDRSGRALSDWTDHVYQTLQPKAEALGHEFNAESWTITLFSEEVVRGSSLGFALSMLLHQAERALRTAANLGVWQIISQGQGTGRVEVVEALRTVQGKHSNEPLVIIADKVNGDEELPEQVVAVLAPDVTDLVSHVAVRARNAHVLFAACSDPDLLAQLKLLKGRFVHAEATPGGDVTYREVTATELRPLADSKHERPVLQSRPKWTQYIVTEDFFDEKVVGAKSCSQARLRGKLPDWVRQPASIALPFGTFEHVLECDENEPVASAYDKLTKLLRAGVNPELLESLRKSIQSLRAPDALRDAFADASARAKLGATADWESAWRCIREVWASKWNERAVLSRRRMRIPDEDLYMAVLIQSVVEADYAFVIHTVNPSIGDADELYAEIVRGLGETLVRNFPGRALGFAYNKRTEQLRLVSYPSKSVGLFGGGLIFRSDSNGEDLAGYAGAGLYDSVVWPPPRKELLDYSNEPLIWNAEFRSATLTAIAKLGIEVEKALGSPQDIEGAVRKGEHFIVQSRPQVGLGQGRSKSQ